MVHAQNKTIENDGSVTDFLNSIEDKKRRDDCFRLLELMKNLTGFEPKMWGPSIVGFGSYHYKYQTGREGDMPLTGFSPRKQNLTIYIMAGFVRYDELVSKLGKFKAGKSCLYLKRLDDADQSVLSSLISESVKHLQSGGKPQY